MAMNKFSPTAVIIEIIQKTDVFNLHMALESSGSYDELPKEYKAIAERLSSELWHWEMYRSGIYKVYGWRFDFGQWMKIYWVKIKGDGIFEIRSFNKTLIRKCATNPSHILKIIEVSK